MLLKYIYYLIKAKNMLISSIKKLGSNALKAKEVWLHLQLAQGYICRDAKV